MRAILFLISLHSFQYIKYDPDYFSNDYDVYDQPNYKKKTSL